MRRDPPTSSCQVKPQRPAPGTAVCGYSGSGVKWAQTKKLGSVVYDTVSTLSFTVFEMKLQTKVVLKFAIINMSAIMDQDTTTMSNYCTRKKKRLCIVVLNVCPPCNWGSDLWKMNQVIALHFPVLYRDHLSQLGKRVTCSTNINLNVKYYTDQSTIPQFIPCKYSINT